MNSTLVFFLNGLKIEDDEVDPEWTLLYYLRNKRGLRGSKLGCGEGGCGACTVMVSRIDRDTRRIDHMSVNACLAPVCSLHGLSVTTVEGIGSLQSGRLHPVQERIAKSHGSQCGFCTPGFVMSMYALLRASSPTKPTIKDLEIAFQGNLCRCTGYRPILEGYQGLSEADSGRSCCGQGGSVCCQQADSEDLFNPTHSSPSESHLHPTQQVIFPPELTITDRYDRESLVFRGLHVTCYRPVTLSELLELRARHPGAPLVWGNTEVGIEMKFKNAQYPYIILGQMVRELRSLKCDERGGWLGSGASISELQDFLTDLLNTQPEDSCKIFKAMLEMMKYFAGKQIRNVATIGGNLMTGSPVSDLIPLLVAARATLCLQSVENYREIQLDSDFWLGYRQNIMKKDEVLVSVIVPFTSKREFFKGYKQSRRKDDDIAIVNCGLYVCLEAAEEESPVRRVSSLRLAFGGMGPTVRTASRTQLALRGRLWNEELLEEGLRCLAEELQLPPNAVGGMVQYRLSLVLSFFFKFYVEVCRELECPQPSAVDPWPGLTAELDRPELSSSQFYHMKPQGGEETPVGRPIVHQSAFKHATGEAVYCDDLDPLEGEVQLGLVLSRRAHAWIRGIDPSPALALSGVLGFFSAQDISPEANHFGSIVHDEEIFASEKVVCVGQVIGAVAAFDLATAQRAAKLVNIQYEDIQPTILTIQEAISEKSYFEDSPFLVERGDPVTELSTAEMTVEGELSIGGQEHFYLEPTSCLVSPLPEDTLEVHATSQHPTELQTLVAECLGLPLNRVVCKVKRLGGGFGGKETRPSLIVLPAAIAAKKLNRPVRVTLERDEDMVITGHRHPFLGRYKVGFLKTGKIVACQLELYCNAGCSKDLSDPVMERAMLHVSNTCLYENVSVKGYVCRTNLPSNTAFRGFGAPQAMLLGETIVFHIAAQLDMDPLQVHSVNFYKNGDITHFKQQLSDCTVDLCWQECIRKSSYHERMEQVIKFNCVSKYTKRGLAMVPTMFGIGFSTPFMNQAGALLLVYTDGSVLLSHGGIEMGQGLHTKMIQVASQALSIPPSYIHISETATDKVPNTSPTAGSASSDLNGMAIIEACEKLLERLKPVKEALPSGSWEDWISEAYRRRISLAATGFYKTEDLGVKTGALTGNTFNYFTYGAACSEVELDILTGAHQVLRTDIVMDLGESLNPAIDIGQVEGAFAQGYGLFTLEELIYSPRGELFSRGPGAYKIPSAADIPAQFNVSLLKGAPNPRAVYSSKACGEPPLFLASSVYFALKAAVGAARADLGLSSWFPLDSPATVQRLRTAIHDHILELVGPSSDASQHWGIPI